MFIDDLIEKLVNIRDGNGDPEGAHAEADRALLDYIDSETVRQVYEQIEKWYA